MNEAKDGQFRSKLESALGPAWATRLRCLVRGRGLPWWGNLRRLKPFSQDFGWDRGTPIDRYYVDRFFERHRGEITGDVLEIDRSKYSRRYGHDLRTVHAFDIDPQCEGTFFCDLAHSENILQSEAYDCVLLPCSLSFFREIDLCLQHALRVVKPGGVILASGAGITYLDGADTDFWRPTPAGWRELLQRAWPGCEIAVEGAGNCLAAVAFNLGLSLEELKTEELEFNDDIYPLVTTIFCRKPKQ